MPEDLIYHHGTKTPRKAGRQRILIFSRSAISRLLIVLLKNWENNLDAMAAFTFSCLFLGVVVPWW
jgi:hypothetical protein